MSAVSATVSACVHSHMALFVCVFAGGLLHCTFSNTNKARHHDHGASMHIYRGKGQESMQTERCVTIEELFEAALACSVVWEWGA